MPSDDTKKNKVKVFEVEETGQIKPLEQESIEDGSVEPEFFADELSFSDPQVKLEFDTSQSTEQPSIQKKLDEIQPELDKLGKLPKSKTLSKDQTDIFKKYIQLKEQEVRDLKDQKSQYQTVLTKLKSNFSNLEQKHREQLKKSEALKSKYEVAQTRLKTMQADEDKKIAKLKSDYKDKLESSKHYHNELEKLKIARDQWRDKVQEDLKKIKLKERELENKYELLKRDTQALLDSKDKHVLELKNKSDKLELDLEGVEERLRNTKTILNGITVKKKKLIETFKLATRLLEQIDQEENEVETNDETSSKKAS